MGEPGQGRPEREPSDPGRSDVEQRRGPPASIAEPLQIALDNGALRALVPVANKKQVAMLPEEVVEELDIAFYGDVDRAVMKGLVG